LASVRWSTASFDACDIVVGRSLAVRLVIARRRSCAAMEPVRTVHRSHDGAIHSKNNSINFAAALASYSSIGSKYRLGVSWMAHHRRTAAVTPWAELGSPPPPVRTTALYAIRISLRVGPIGFKFGGRNDAQPFLRPWRLRVCVAPSRGRAGVCWGESSRC
jgi:hypothetical protein